MDFYIAAAAHTFVLEWSAPTREESGRTSHATLEAAISEATRRFGINPERWTDGDPFKCLPWQKEDQSGIREYEAAIMPGIWEFFSWSAPLLPELVDALQVELNQRIIKHEQEKELYPNDHDERTINRAWCDELTATLRRWCGLLELSPECLPGYREALRRSVWNEDLMGTDAIPQVALAMLQARGSIADPVFRPVCLEAANRSIMEWLRRHPSDVDRVHYRTFEAIVAEAICTAGWSVELTKQTRDGGYDIMCLKNDRAGVPIRMLVETKLYSLDHPVGLPIVDRLMGVRDREHADRAVLVTNSKITGTVWKLWEDRVGRDLTLVDREELFEWLRDGQAQM